MKILLAFAAGWIAFYSADQALYDGRLIAAPGTSYSGRFRLLLLGLQVMKNRQTLPHWIVGLTAVAMLLKPSVISIDAVAISGFVAFIAATLWAAHDAS